MHNGRSQERFLKEDNFMKSKVSLNSTSQTLNHLRILFERVGVSRPGRVLRFCVSIKLTDDTRVVGPQTIL